MNIQAFEPFTINLSLKKPISKQMTNFAKLKNPKAQVIGRLKSRIIK
jgi:hypothetical protein